ncbi:MAG: SDR family NAD(P)-dependent oxidoreductase [Micrococcales bacterium]
MQANDSENWAVVTGASDGIGRALSLVLGAKGYSVIAVGRSEAKLMALESSFTGSGKILTHSVDLSVPGSAAVLESLVAGKNVTVFAPAAGFGSSGNFTGLNLQNELSMIDVNCRSVVEQTQWFAQAFAAHGTGSIVLFSSLLGTAGAGTSAVYAATKNFIHAFAEGLRQELKKSGVNVLTVCPGPTTSGFAQVSQMTYSGADTAEDVAKGIVRSISKNGTIYPAPRARLLGFTLGTVPRSLRVGILTSVMSGLQQKH